MRIKIRKIRKNCVAPRQQSNGSSGFDIAACIDTEIIINPGARKLIPTGFKIEIPRPYEAQIRSRSGLSYKHGIIVLNSPGTIDSDYRDEVGVILYNCGEKSYAIKPGDRIAQMVFMKVEYPELQEVKELSSSDRRGGFGSTGV